MKRIFSLILAFSCLSFAQAATRPVVLTWTASTSSSVTGYAVYSCTVPSGATSCTPTMTGTPNVVTGTTFTIQETVNAAYGFSIVAQAPACSSTTPMGTPCGNASPATVTYVPVPPQTAGATQVIVVVP